MSYYDDTVRLLTLYKKTENLNCLRHFFSTLSTIREIYPIAIINSITSTATSVEELVYDSITTERWMSRISLTDIRNYIVFTVYKDFQKVIKTEPYIDPNNTNASMLQCDKESTIGFHVDKLARLIETVFYIHHVYVIKYQPEKIEKNNWKMCHEYLNEVSLIESTEFLFQLLERMIIS